MKVKIIGDNMDDEKKRINLVHSLRNAELQEAEEAAENDNPRGKHQPTANPRACLSEQQLSNLEYLSMSNSICASDRERAKDNEFCRKEAHADRELERKKDLLKYREYLQMRRELKSYELAELDDGIVYKILRDPDGNVIGGRPSCTAKFLTLKAYFAEGELDRVYLLTWEDGESGQRQIAFCEEKLTVQQVGRMLIREGVSLRGDSNRRRDLLAELLAFLAKNCIYEEVPRTTGWVKYHNRWRFVKKGEKNLEEMIGHVQE